MILGGALSTLVSLFAVALSAVHASSPPKSMLEGTTWKVWNLISCVDKNDKEVSFGSRTDLVQNLIIASKAPKPLRLDYNHSALVVSFDKNTLRTTNLIAGSVKGRHSTEIYLIERVEAKVQYSVSGDGAIHGKYLSSRALSEAPEANKGTVSDVWDRLSHQIETVKFTKNLEQEFNAFLVRSEISSRDATYMALKMAIHPDDPADAPYVKACAPGSAAIMFSMSSVTSKDLLNEVDR